MRNLTRRGDIYYFRRRIDGKLYRVSTGFSDLRAAQRRAVELEYEIRSGLRGWRKQTVSFQAWAETYLKTHTVRKRRGQRDHQILAHVLPRWGCRPLDTITRTDCEAYLHERHQEGAKPGTLNRERGLLCAMFNVAIDDGLLTTNPFRGVRRVSTSRRDRVLDIDEQSALMGELNAAYRRLVTVFLGTGLRHDEARRLRPRDVKTDHIRVREETAKGFKLRRVPLLPEVVEALEGQGAFRQCRANDRFWSQRQCAILKTVKAAARRAGLEPLTVHDLRRTFATRCATAGMPMPQLAEILGHSSTQVTSQYYVHVRMLDLSRALGRIDLKLRPTQDTKVIPLRLASS